MSNWKLEESVEGKMRKVVMQDGQMIRVEERARANMTNMTNRDGAFSSTAVRAPAESAKRILFPVHSQYNSKCTPHNHAYFSMHQLREGLRTDPS